MPQPATGAGAEPLEWYEVPAQWYPMFPEGGANDWYAQQAGVPWYHTDWFTPTYTPGV